LFVAISVSGVPNKPGRRARARAVDIDADEVPAAGEADSAAADGGPNGRRIGSSMMIAFARPGYCAPSFITVAAPIECPIRIGFSNFIVWMNPTTSFTSVSPSSFGVNGSLRPWPRAGRSP